MMMGVERNRASLGQRPFWRRLVGTALIYALVMQPLWLAIVGAQLANAATIDDLALTQLCQHATGAGPLPPADRHKHPGNDHCALCFAAAFQLLDAPRPGTIHEVGSEAGKVAPSAYPLRRSLISRYFLASPRGPPLSA